MNVFYYILHKFTGCPDEDLKHYRNGTDECEKCGRVTFLFKTYGK